MPESINERGLAGMTKLFEDLKSRVDDKTILPSEMRVFLDLKKKLLEEDDSATTVSSCFEVKTNVLAGILGVSCKTIGDWTTKLGMKKVRYGIYDLRDAFKFWREKIVRSSSDTEEFIKARERTMVARAEAAEIKLAVSKGEVVSREDVISAWCHRIAEFGGACKALRNRLPPVLVGKDTSTMKLEIDRELDTLFSAFKRRGKFCESK